MMPRLRKERHSKKLRVSLSSEALEIIIPILDFQSLKKIKIPLMVPLLSGLLTAINDTVFAFCLLQVYNPEKQRS
jgi:hypothetical protein